MITRKNLVAVATSAALAGGVFAAPAFAADKTPEVDPGFSVVTEEATPADQTEAPAADTTPAKGEEKGSTEDLSSGDLSSGLSSDSKDSKDAKSEGSSDSLKGIFSVLGKLLAPILTKVLGSLSS